tara:strand:+ start:115787 stop:116338 length:552 start_codon:yes stop_codon:yes gene_type:complete
VEKKLTLKGFTILLAYYVLAATTFACKSGSEKSSTEKDNENAIEPSTEVILAPSQNKEGFLKLFKGDSTIHRIHLNDKILYESLILKDKRIYNFIFPRITDSFLFEDKYYLKISYPMPFSGTIETTIPDCPDYVLTPLANGILQVVIYNALDLSAVDLKFNYLPSEKDSLVSSVYHFKHIIFD